MQRLYRITVKAVIQIFNKINEGTANGNIYKLTCSYIEVYNEKIKCLLLKKDDLKIRENPAGDIYVAEKEERRCLTPESIFAVLKLFFNRIWELGKDEQKCNKIIIISIH